MAAANQYTLDRIQINSGGSGVGVKGCVGYRLSPNIARELNAGGSELDPSVMVLPSGAPEIEFASRDVNTLLTNMFDGVKPVPHIVVSSTKFYFARLADGGTRGGAGVNLIMQGTSGLIVPRRLRKSGGVAELTCVYYPDSSDGVTTPLTFLTAQNLLGGSAGASALWVVRGIKDNTDILVGLRDIDVDFGVSVARQQPANALFPMNTLVSGYAPTASFQSANVGAALGLSGTSGKVAGAAGLQIFLGQYDNVPANATYGQVLSTGAIALVLKAGSPWWPEPLSGQAGLPLLANFHAAGKGGDTVAVADSPLSLSTGLSLPAESVAATWMLGPMRENGIDYAVRSVNIDFGQSGWIVRGPSNLLWPNYCTLMRREPRFAIGLDSTEFAIGLGLMGRAATTFIQYLRSCTANSVPIADATSAHVSLAAGSGSYVMPGGLAAAHAGIVDPALDVIVLGGLTISSGVAIL